MKENVGGLLGGEGGLKGMFPPPLHNYWGAAPHPPSSYAYVL